jgi:acetyltransferase
VLAADELQDAGGVLATVSPATLAALDGVLPRSWSHGNPVDIIGDAGPERYKAALSALLEDPASDAILVLQCPTAIASSTEAARAVVGALKDAATHQTPSKLVLTNWLGEEAPRDARALFSAEEIPTFETPSEAITGFMQLVRHARAQRELTRTPPARGPGKTNGTASATAEIKQSLTSGTKVLSAVGAKSILRFYGIPVADTLIAADPHEVARHATTLLAGHPACVVKILSRDISHKSDVGGVRLGLESAAAAEQAAREMIARIAVAKPGAVIDGFMVEPMIRRPHAQEVIIGMIADETFGPMLLFGAGGTAVEVIQDRALGLPPLDMLLARQMIAETRISRLLAGYRDRPPADLDALAAALVQTSELIIHHPEIRELDINPLLVDETGIIALDARMKIEDQALFPRRPLAIKPYPAEWEMRLDVAGLGPVDVRPVRPDDEERYRRFFALVSPDDIRLRFFTARAGFSHQLLARFTQIDYAREMAFVALSPGEQELMGVVRVALDPDLVRGEYGILIRSDLKGKGLGWRLMDLLITYARKERIAELSGLVLAENTTMLGMAREFGFEIRPVPGDATAREVVLDVSRATATPPTRAAE